MPRTREASRRIRDEQRARILDAARRVFARKGLSASMDDVAAEAGVSHGLAYHYFASKTALVSELILQDLEAPAGWLEQFVREQAVPMEKIRQMVTGLVESRRDHPERYQLLAQALNDEAAPEEMRQRVAQRGRELQAVLRELIVAGQAAGEVAPGEPDQLVRAVFAALEGLTARPIPDLVAYRADFPAAEFFLRMLEP
jgi:AcrR family transcriptional regulator